MCRGIIVAGATVTIEDLGTFIGTRRVVGSMPVMPGDDIVIGTIRMRLVQVDAMATTATAT